MLELKKDNLHIFIKKVGFLSDVAVCVSFKANLNSCCLNKLKNAHDCNCFPAGSEEACVCYAMYLNAHNELCGNPLAIAKSKVGSVDCGAHNGSFSIYWKVKGTGSAVRKSIGIVLKCLQPYKVYSAYSQCLKLLNKKPAREEFNYVANALNKSLKDHVMCGVIGNIRVEKKDDQSEAPKLVPAIDLSSMLVVLAKKLMLADIDSVKSAPKNHTECTHVDKTEINVNGWASHVVKDYILSKLKGVNVVICNKYVLLSLKSALWQTQSAKLKKGVKDYVQAKYAKLDSDLSAVMGYLMFAHASVCAPDVYDMVKKQISAQDVESTIVKVL